MIIEIEKSKKGLAKQMKELEKAYEKADKSNPQIHKEMIRARVDFKTIMKDFERYS